MSEPIQAGKIDYLLCQVLYSLSAALEGFPNGQMQEAIEQTLALIQNKNMKVAVIGEFRRGKSSLINALLGMPVLPVDIEPTTAAINRITYGLKPKAIIHFKNGDTAQVPIEALSDYITKLTPSAAQMAATVAEAEIQYPTELCSNRIDIIDTPGLNDTESMTLVTESLLEDIHMAVVAVKSTMPYSETECHWVTRLLALPKLSHIVFVLTCMDLVRRPEREKVLSYTKKRICEKTLEAVRVQYADQPELIAKAERMFQEDSFALYPVSAALALESFETGDYELLAQSNIAALKKGLLTAMNAQQQMVGVYASEQLLEQVSAWYGATSIAQHTEALTQQLQALSDANTRTDTYFAQRSGEMDSTAKAIDGEVRAHVSACLSENNLENAIRKIFIAHISAVPVGTGEAIGAAMEAAQQEISQKLLLPLDDRLRKGINAAILRNTNAFWAQRDSQLDYGENKALLEEGGIPASAQLKALLVQRLKAGFSTGFPQFSVSVPAPLLNKNIIQTVVMPSVLLFGKKYRKAWDSALPAYIQSWQGILLQAEPQALSGRFCNLIYSHKGAVSERISYLQAQHRKVALLIEEKKGQVKQLKESLLTEK